MRDQATLTIANGQTDSNDYEVPSPYDILVIKTPATLTGTVTLHGSLDGGSTFQPMFSDGAAITIAAGAIVTVAPLGVDVVRLVSGSAEGAQRDFEVRATVSR